MGKVFYNPGTLILIFIYIFIIHNIDLILTTTRERKFQLKNYCNVTVLPSKVVSWTVSYCQCGVQCSYEDSCFAYVYGDKGVCKLYAQNILSQNQCSPGQSAGSLGVFVKFQERVCEHGGQLDESNICVCIDGYTGSYCERVIEDCTEGFVLGYRSDQLYWIKPKLAPAAFQVNCQMSTGGGFTKFQTCIDGAQSFNKTWQEYKVGFILNSGTDFWLGNEKIHWITASYPQMLLVQLSNTTHLYQRYHGNFLMTNETEDFAVTYSSSLSPADTTMNMDTCWPGTSIKFSTYDRDNDGDPENCASLFGAGFWFQSENCSLCNPNGKIHHNQSTRLNIPSENFWTPTLDDWTPTMVAMALFRMS